MTKERLRRLRERLRDDRGSLSMAVVIWTPIVLVLCAFVVNVGYLISDRERASDLAEQAARRVADQIDEGVAHANGGVLRIDVPPNATDCSAIAQDYFTENRITDVDPASVTCQITNNPEAPTYQLAAGLQTQVTVTIQMTHHTLFTGFPLGDPATVGATGSATPITVG